jgi:hypothetical protein
MPDARGKKIGGLLRREAVAVARDAARLFVHQLHVDAQSLAAPAEGGPAATSLVVVDGSPDEAEAILADGFQKLTGVVALSLQVGEPRLVSEELQWLDMSIGARFEAVYGASDLDRLIDAYSGACRQYLSDDDSDILTDWLAQARSGLAETEPLLTEPGTRSHLEGSHPQDQ